MWRFVDPERRGVPGQVIVPEDIEVLMVHRPRYKDWSWPKGKSEANEPIICAAIREVEEETGASVILGVPLTTQRYRLGSGQTKEVRYWVGTLADDGRRTGLETSTIAPTTTATPVPAPVSAPVKVRISPAIFANRKKGQAPKLAPVPTHMPEPANKQPVVSPVQLSRSSAISRVRTPVKPAPASEIDETRWVSPGQAEQMLTRRGDRRLLQELVARAEEGRLVTVTLGLVRHAKAVSRTQWAGDEATRPLTRLGVRQAMGLVDVLSAFGIERAVSSSWIRCQQTLGPWESVGGGRVEVRDELTEAAVATDPASASAVVAQCVRQTNAVVVCAHRPTIPALLDPIRAVTPSTLLRLLPSESPWLTTAQMLVVHISHASGRPEVDAIETHGTRTKDLLGL